MNLLYISNSRRCCIFRHDYSKFRGSDAGIQIWPRPQSTWPSKISDLSLANSCTEKCQPNELEIERSKHVINIKRHFPSPLHNNNFPSNPRAVLSAKPSSLSPCSDLRDLKTNLVNRRLQSLDVWGKPSLQLVPGPGCWKGVAGIGDAVSQRSYPIRILLNILKMLIRRSVRPVSTSSRASRSKIQGQLRLLPHLLES